MSEMPESRRNTPAMRRVLGWLVRISLPIAVLSLPLFLLFTNSYVEWHYRSPGFPPSERFSAAERSRLSSVIINYIRGRASLEEMRTMRTDQGEVAMRDSEVLHIVDVKGVTNHFFGAGPAAAYLLILASIALWQRSRRDLARAIRGGVYFTLGLIVLIVAASLIDFSVFFDRFHRVFFTSDSWLFYYEDTLIQLYPLPLWQGAVVHLGVVILAELVILYLVAWLINRRAPADKLIQRA